MTKFTVTKYGKPVDPDLYVWDEENKIFSTKTWYLKIDFGNASGITFNATHNCIFITGNNCNFNTGVHCNFYTGNNCVFDTKYLCIFNTGKNCDFHTGCSCTFFTKSNCTFNTGDRGDFKTGNNCNFNVGYDCDFNVGNNCFCVSRGFKDSFKLPYRKDAETFKGYNGFLLADEPKERVFKLTDCKYNKVLEFLKSA